MQVVLRAAADKALDEKSERHKYHMSGIDMTQEYSFLSFSPHFDVICDLLLNMRTATWNLLNESSSQASCKKDFFKLFCLDTFPLLLSSPLDYKDHFFICGTQAAKVLS